MEKSKALNFSPGMIHIIQLMKDACHIMSYELCEKMDVPVLFHTGENSGDSECAKWNDPRHIVEVAKRYPKLKVIIAHYFWPQLPAA